MYQLNISFVFLVFFHLHSIAKGADPVKNVPVPLKTTSPLNFPTADQLTDSILSRMNDLVDAEVEHGNSTLFIPVSEEIEGKPSKELNHEDRLSSTILCSNHSKCKTLTLRESRTLKTLAFLAGLKFGKHFLQGAQVGAGFQNSGSFAASNSLNLFGKVLNTALSVSYGSPLEGDIVADEPTRPSFMSDVYVHTGVKSPLADLTTALPEAASVVMTITSTEVSSKPLEELKPVDVTTDDSEPSFKHVPEQPEAVSSEPQVKSSSNTDSSTQPSLKVTTVYSTGQPHPTQTIVSSVRHSQPKTKEQLFYSSRKRFLDEHNERFRKLFRNNSKPNAIPQIGVMLY